MGLRRAMFTGLLQAMLAVGLVGTSGQAAPAKDIAEVESNDGSGRTYLIEGSVVDFTGEQLVILTDAGVERTVPTERVQRIESSWLAEHEAGDAAFDNKEWEAAARQYAAANRAESRMWVRRRILTRLLRCYRYLQRDTAAGELFLLLVQSDSHTPAYRFAPLAWNPVSNVDQQQAELWLEKADQPAAVLLGASHLLATDKQEAATQALHALRQEASEEDRMLASFAEAQLWRTEITRATLKDIELWEQRTLQFPSAVQGGAWFMIGNAYAQQDQAERAVLAYLRTSLLFPELRHLAARSLTAAARLAEKTGNASEAKTMLAEVLDKYQDTEEYEVANRQMRELAADQQ